MKIEIKSVFATIIILTLLVTAGCSSGYSTEVKKEFAKCLSGKGATMFGAYWCSHCQQQKKLFGSAWDQVDYIECSLPGGQAQTEVCIQAKIQSYPTWEFAPNDRLTGKLSLEQLSAKSGCPLS